jgi:hypothetical protein
MKLELDATEYRKLIELAYLGEWMVNAQHDPDFHDEEARSVLQKLLAAQAQPDVDRDEETGDFFMSTDWIEELYDQYVVDYDDHVFWDELTERLAQRDLARERGVPVEEVNRDDDLPELRPLEEKYHQELGDRGLERLEIVEDYK